MFKFEFCALEPRLLFTSVVVTDNPLLDDYPTAPRNVVVPANFHFATTVTAVTGPDPVSLAASATSIPQLHSLPGAKDEIYLDFLGADAMTWGSNSVPATPAYSVDSDATTFSPTELADIQQIWARVSEKYSPFNIDVTTVDPVTYTPGVVVRAVIGGDGSWMSPAGGVSYVGGFNGFGQPSLNYNTVFIFPDNLGDGDPKYTAEATAHEAGHNFGLNHQSVYSGTTKTAEYNSGTALTAPIMGNSYYAVRGLWWDGQSDVSSTTIQDDMSVIASSTNGFGYRADDFGNSAAAATVLTPNGSSVSINGVIQKTSDTDWFTFSTQPGQISFAVAPAQYGGMLNATLKLVDSTGKVLATADTTALGETISFNATAGSYCIVVGSHGTYGDVGQYTLTGTINNDPNYIPAPTTLAASYASGAVKLTWHDNASNETNYIVQRSDDGGTTWNTIATLDPNSISYTDSTVSVGSKYAYRVFATNDNANSAYSNTATVTLLPPAPVGLAVSSIGSTQIALTWSAVGGASSYKIDRSTNGTTWTRLATVTGATTYTDSSVSGGTKYYYRIRSSSAAGDSANSAPITVLTKPIPPANIAATAVTPTAINLTWSAVTGATGYLIEQSSDGGTTWNQIVSVGGTTLKYLNTGLTTGTSYSYRIRATDASGNSDYSSVATATPTSDLGVNAPSSLNVVLNQFSQPALSWTDNATNETGFRIQRSSDGGTTWTNLASVAANVTTYTDTTAVKGKTYTYRVSAADSWMQSDNSNTQAVTIPPASVTGLRVTATTKTSIGLAWTAVAGDAAIRIERYVDANTGWVLVTSLASGSTSYTITGLSEATSYQFRVRSGNSGGDSAWTNITASTIFPAPTALSLHLTAPTTVALQWTDNADVETAYILQRSTNGGTSWVDFAQLAPNTTTYTDSTLAHGGTYVYRVLAVDGSLRSNPSNSVAVTTAPSSPSSIKLTAVSSTSVSFAWSDVAGETKYLIERSIDGGTSWAQVGTTLANITSVTNINLSPSTHYLFRIRASNAGGTSDPSPVLDVTTSSVTGKSTAKGALSVKVLFSKKRV